MKTPDQLKGSIRSIATKKHLRAQEVLQMFFFERILERLSKSEYRKNFILKGGLLISSMIGIQERTTMDMDTTVYLTRASLMIRLIPTHLKSGQYISQQQPSSDE